MHIEAFRCLFPLPLCDVMMLCDAWCNQNLSNRALNAYRECDAEISHDYPLADIVIAGDLNQLSDDDIVRRTYSPVNNDSWANADSGTVM